MLTRAEQIQKLEEAFNTLVLNLSKSVIEGQCGERHRAYALQLEAITTALTYLRTCIPNPEGRQDPTTHRSRKLVL